MSARDPGMRPRGRHTTGPTPKSAPPTGVPEPTPGREPRALEAGPATGSMPTRALEGPRAPGERSRALSPANGVQRVTTPPPGGRALERVHTPPAGVRRRSEPAHSPPHGIKAIRRGGGSLFLAECARIAARRFVRWLVLLALVGVAVGTAVVWYLHTPVTSDGLVNAQHRMDDRIAVIDQKRADCLANPPTTFPGGPTVEEICGPSSAELRFTINQFLDPPPFILAEDGIPGAVGVGIGAAAVAYLISATFLGAEWSTRNLVALLFWEPRRNRVMFTKLAVAALASAGVAVLMEALWVPLAMVVSHYKGNPVTTGLFWHDLLITDGRCVWMAVLGGVLGFGAANLVRGTAGALGLAFIYFAVVEAAVRAFWADGIPYLLSTYAIALLQQGGTRITPPEATLTGASDIVISNALAGTVLTVFSLAFAYWGIWRFGRKDIQ